MASLKVLPVLVAALLLLTVPVGHSEAVSSDGEGGEFLLPAEDSGTVDSNISGDSAQVTQDDANSADDDTTAETEEIQTGGGEDEASENQTSANQTDNNTTGEANATAENTTDASHNETDWPAGDSPQSETNQTTETDNTTAETEENQTGNSSNDGAARNATEEDLETSIEISHEGSVERGEYSDIRISYLHGGDPISGAEVKINISGTVMDVPELSPGDYTYRFSALGAGLDIGIEASKDGYEKASESVRIEVRNPPAAQVAESPVREEAAQEESPAQPEFSASCGREPVPIDGGRWHECAVGLKNADKLSVALSSDSTISRLKVHYPDAGLVSPSFSGPLSIEKDVSGSREPIIVTDGAVVRYMVDSDSKGADVWFERDGTEIHRASVSLSEQGSGMTASLIRPIAGGGQPSLIWVLYFASFFVLVAMSLSLLRRDAAVAAFRVPMIVLFLLAVPTGPSSIAAREGRNGERRGLRGSPKGSGPVEFGNLGKSSILPLFQILLVIGSIFGGFASYITVDSQLADADPLTGEPWRGYAFAHLEGSLGAGRDFALSITDVDPQSDTGDQPDWEYWPGAGPYTLRFEWDSNGASPGGDAPDELFVAFYDPVSQTQIGSAWNPAISGSSGLETRTIHFDDDPLDQSLGSPRYGSLEMYFWVADTDGGVNGDYNVSSKGEADTDDHARGYFRSNAILDDFTQSNMTFNGNKPSLFAFPDPIFLNATLGEGAYGDNTLTAKINDSATAVRQEANTSQEHFRLWDWISSGNCDACRVGDDFDDDEDPFRLEFTNITFTASESDPLYAWNDTGQLSGFSFTSDLILDSTAGNGFGVNPEINITNSLTPPPNRNVDTNETIFNRGETVQYGFAVLNTRNEVVNESGTVKVFADNNLEEDSQTVSGDGDEFYNNSYTIASMHQALFNNIGSPKHFGIVYSDNSANSANAHNVSNQLRHSSVSSSIDNSYSVNATPARYNRGEAVNSSAFIYNIRGELWKSQSNIFVALLNTTDQIEAESSTADIDSNSFLDTVLTLPPTADASNDFRGVEYSLRVGDSFNNWISHDGSENKTADGAFNVSSWYLVNAHAETDSDLDKSDSDDTFPDPDETGQESTAIIAADVVFGWGEVRNARNESLEGVDVNLTYFRPDGTQAQLETHATGSDGWTTDFHDMSTEAPSGVWKAHGNVTGHNGNSGGDVDGIEFISPYTGNLGSVCFVKSLIGTDVPKNVWNFGDRVTVRCEFRKVDNFIDERINTDNNDTRLDIVKVNKNGSQIVLFDDVGMTWFDTGKYDFNVTLNASNGFENNREYVILGNTKIDSRDVLADGTFFIKEDQEEIDPLHILCSGRVDAGETVYCGVTSLFLNGTARNGIGFNWTATNTTGSETHSGVTIDSGSDGDHFFNFTPSARDSYRVKVFNRTEGVSKTTMVQVIDRTLTAEQNETLYGANALAEEINSTTNRTETTVNQINSTVNDILSIVQDLETVLHRLEEFTNTTLFNEMASRFDAVDGNLTEIDATMSSVNDTVKSEAAATRSNLTQEIGSLETSLTNLVNSRSDSIDGNLTEIDTSLANLETRVDANFTDIRDRLIGLDSSLSGNFTDIQSNFSTVISELDALDGTVSAVEIDVQDVLVRLPWSVYSTTNESLQVHHPLGSNISASRPVFIYTPVLNGTQTQDSSAVFVNGTASGHNATAVKNSTHNMIQSNRTLSDGYYEWYAVVFLSDGSNLTSSTQNFTVLGHETIDTSLDSFRDNNTAEHRLTRSNLTEGIDSLRTHIDIRFDAVDGNLTEIDMSLTNLETRIEANFSDARTRLTNINTTLIDFRNDVGDNFTTTLANIEGINQTTRDTKTVVDDIQSTVDALDTFLRNAWGSFTAETIISNTTSQINQSVADARDSVRENVSEEHRLTRSNLTSEISSLQTVLEARFDTVDTTLAGFESRMSSNFTDVRGRLTDMNATLLEVGTNLTSVNSTLHGRFDTVDSKLAALDSNLEGNMTDLRDRLTNINSSLLEVGTNLTSVNSTMHTELDNIDTTLSEFESTVNNNFTDIRDRINNIDSSLAGNFTEIDGDFNTTFARFDSVDGNLTEIDTTLVAIDSSMDANFTDIRDRLTNINTTLVDFNSSAIDRLDEVNDTTQDTNTRLIAFREAWDAFKAKFDAIWGDDTAETIKGNITQNITEKHEATLTNLTTQINDLDGLVEDFESRMASNFTAVDEDFDLVFGNLTEIDTAITNVNSSLLSINTTLNTRLDTVDISITSVNDTVKSEAEETRSNLTSEISSLQAVLEARFDTVDTTLADFEGRVDSNFTDLRTRVNSINDTVLAVNTSLHGRFDTVETKLNALDSNFESNFSDLRARLDEINTTTRGTNADLTNVNSSIHTEMDGIDTQLTDFESSVNDNFTDIRDRINNIDSSLGNNFTAISGRFDSVDGNLTEVDTQLTAMDSSMDANFTDVRDRLTNINTTLVGVGANVTSVNETVKDEATDTRSNLTAQFNDLFTQLTRLELFTNTTFFDNNTEEHQLTRSNLTEEIQGLNTSQNTQEILDAIEVNRDNITQQLKIYADVPETIVRAQDNGIVLYAVKPDGTAADISSASYSVIRGSDQAEVTSGSMTASGNRANATINLDSNNATGEYQLRFNISSAVGGKSLLWEGAKRFSLVESRGGGLEVKGATPNFASANETVRAAATASLNGKFTAVDSATLNITKLGGSSEFYEASSNLTIESGRAYRDHDFASNGTYTLEWNMSVSGDYRQAYEIVVVSDFEDDLGTIAERIGDWNVTGHSSTPVSYIPASNTTNVIWVETNGTDKGQAWIKYRASNNLSSGASTTFNGTLALENMEIVESSCFNCSSNDLNASTTSLNFSLNTDTHRGFDVLVKLIHLDGNATLDAFVNGARNTSITYSGNSTVSSIPFEFQVLSAELGSTLFGSLEEQQKFLDEQIDVIITDLDDILDEFPISVSSGGGSSSSTTNIYNNVAESKALLEETRSLLGNVSSKEDVDKIVMNIEQAKAKISESIGLVREVKDVDLTGLAALFSGLESASTLTMLLGLAFLIMVAGVFVYLMWRSREEDTDFNKLLFWRMFGNSGGDDNMNKMMAYSMMMGRKDSSDKMFKYMMAKDMIDGPKKAAGKEPPESKIDTDKLYHEVKGEIKREIIRRLED